MLKPDENAPRQSTSFAENHLKDHEILRPFNLHPLHLVVKCVHPQSSAVLFPRKMLYNRHPHTWDSNGVRRSGLQAWHPVGGRRVKRKIRRGIEIALPILGMGIT